MENELIAALRRRIAQEAATENRLLRGPGDDAAILRRVAGYLVVTTDLLSDGVDFIVGETEPELIGRKALCVNLSDLAAMGAAPHSVVVSILLPETFGPRVRGKKGAQSVGAEGVARFAERLYDGMAPVARRFHTAIAGGDTNSWRGGLVLSVTAMGTVAGRRALLRSGAKPGDRILTTGRFGGSIFGRQFTFTPRLLEALYLNRYYRIHAAIDTSDGLLLDLSRLAAESGVGFRINEAKVPIHPDTAKGTTPALRAALGDGEDFELILAVPPKEAARLLADQPFVPRRKRGGKSVLEKGSAEKSVAERIEAICEATGIAPELAPASEAALLTDIGEFLPKETGTLRVTAEGKTLPITDFFGWKHFFD